MFFIIKRKACQPELVFVAGVSFLEIDRSAERNYNPHRFIRQNTTVFSHGCHYFQNRDAISGEGNSRKVPRALPLGFYVPLNAPFLKESPGGDLKILFGRRFRR